MGSYSVGQLVEVRYPGSPGHGLDRDEWPWMPGTILGTDVDPSGREEYHVRVDVEDLAEEDEDDPDGPLWYPACFRTPEELRPYRPTAVRTVGPTP